MKLDLPPSGELWVHTVRAAIVTAASAVGTLPADKPFAIFGTQALLGCWFSISVKS